MNRVIKRRKKLLLQVTLIIVPVFMLMIAAVIWAVYTSSVNSYLKAQEKQTEDIMQDAMFMQDLTDISPTGHDEKVRGWIAEQLGEVEYSGSLQLTEEENKAYNDYMNILVDDLYDWYADMPDEIKPLMIKSTLHSSLLIFDRSKPSGGFDSLVYVGRNKTDKIRILMDMNEDRGESENGKFYDLDISKHPVLEEVFNGDGSEMKFERTDDFPLEGYYYIGYYPVEVKGEVTAVMGIVYNWKDMRSSVMQSINRAVVIIIAGMVLLMVLVLLFLYSRAVKPVTQMTKAVGGYKDDNSTENIVKNMNEIRSNNELGYLSDAIADFAIDIDRSNKENLRIAVERERAEAERERAEKEAYEAKVAVMASQIRPHFMYNALTSIAMMCQIDPETAQEATITFAKYLRGNMDSLKQTKPVSFEVELEHLKKYLYIEKLRFGKKLNVEYDIQATGFSLPMLSVQPLAENAVKHGVGMKKNGGTVTIISRETEDAFEVIVRDDGVGFDTSAEREDDGRSHVGMENTRSRLKEMCGGTVNIESTVGVGTTATIILPKEDQNNEDTLS